VNSIPIVRAGADGRAVAVVDLIRRPDGSRTHRIGRDTVWADTFHDPAMARLVAPYAAVADSVGRSPVTVLAEALPPTGDRRLGHSVADAARLAADADIGMYNPGGIRAALPAGVVTYADLYRVLPFGNTVVRLSLTGRQLRQLVERTGIRYYYSNLHVRYDPEARPGSRIVSVSFPDGTPILEDRSYTLGTVDFLAAGGDGLTMLTALPREYPGVPILDAMIAHLRSLPAPVVIPAERRVLPVR
jgi:5'-nucleotidase